jgi:hypothetical protein
LQAVAFAVVFAFLVGLALGVVLGRRNPKPGTEVVSPSLLGTAPRRTKPSKRAAKAGLTDESFTPADDILDKLRRAAEGELDPAELGGSGAPPPTAAQVQIDLEKAERERRVLERLRHQQAQGDPPASDLANDRDSDDIR